MNSATLRKPIQIYRLETKTTEYGTIEAEYVLHYSTRANILFESQTQVNTNGEVFYPSTRMFIVRSYVDVVEQDRIRWDDKWWKITSINENEYYGNIEIRTTLVNT